MEPATIILTTITIAALTSSIIIWRNLTKRIHSNQQSYSNKREQHEKILTKTEAERTELKLLLNSFDDALVITNEAGIIQVSNKAANQLCQRHTIRGKSISSTLLDHEICECITKAIKKNKPKKQKLILTSSTFGQEETIENSAWIIDYAPLPLDNDTPLHRIIIRNVSSEHRTDQVKREFVANASHELRTPLAIINGYLENLIDDNIIENPNIARKALTTMRKHSDRLAQLIEEMLIISKLESGAAAQLKNEPFQINDTISTVIDRLSPLTQKQKATIITHFDPELITFTGDAFYWEQAIYNLIENALKQNANTPIQITVDTKISETKKDNGNKKLTIKITDNGKGIPTAHLPYIFNRFYRVQKHHSQNQVRGTGLGLSIVKHAIEAHGGKIKASSTPGIETTFKITCPIKK